MENKKIIKRVVCYARVSTSHQQENETIKTQILAMEEFAYKNGYDIVERYEDDGWSGSLSKRPDLDRLLTDAEKKKWDAILIYSPDRLSRRYAYQEIILDKLDEIGMDVIFVTTPIPKNTNQRLVYGVTSVVAEHARETIIEGFRQGKMRKVKEGHLLVSEPAYGFRYIPKSGKRHGYYEIDEYESGIVKMIFIWVGEHCMTIRGVVRKLQELGIKPRKSKRGVWSTSTLTTLLRNKAYIGEAHYGASYAVVPERPQKNQKYKKIKKTSRRMKPEEEWIKIPVPAFIEKDLFEKVQRQLKSNMHLSTRNNTKNQYLFRGMFRCACGSTRAGQGHSSSKHTYYRCSNNVLNFPNPRSCKAGGINSIRADKLIWSKIMEIMTSPELLREQYNRWRKDNENGRQATQGESEFIEKEILKLKSAEERYNKAYGAKHFTLEDLIKYTTPIREEIKSLENKLVEVKAQELPQNKPLLPSFDEIEAFAEKARETLQNLNFEAKRAIVMNVVEKIVGTSQLVTVSGFIPLNHVTIQTKHRYCRFTKRREKHAFQAFDIPGHTHRELSIRDDRPERGHSARPRRALEKTHRN